MKYWRGYIFAIVFVAITWALDQFARAHSVLVDMIYPYVTRLVINSLADWTGGMAFCLWQVLLIILVLLALVSIVLMIVLRWNPIQWLGWVLASVSLIYMLQFGLYGLNEYASPLADDVRLTVTDYTVTELSDATIYFRDQANALAKKVARDKKGNPDFGSFADLAEKAGDGFYYLTYEKAISVFSGSRAPVKKLTFHGGYTLRRDSGVTVALTGEACVNPDVPSALLPFAMCKEISHRMSIYSEEDAQFGGFLAGIYNSDPAFQYSAYLTAYRLCYDALAATPTSTGQACAKEADSGVNEFLRADLEDYTDFYGKSKNATASQMRTGAKKEEPQEELLITYSEYSSAVDLLASWYIQEFVTPLHTEEEAPFNPLDASQVDLTVAPPKPAE